MTSPSPGPCSWSPIWCDTVDPDVPGCTHLAALAAPMAAAIISAATEDVWRWTGRRFGLCEIQVRPCSEECQRRSTWQGWSGNPAGYLWAGGAGFFPYISQGLWFNGNPCGSCNKDRCGCQKLSTIVLPGPVNSVTEVRVDGLVLATTAYRLDNLGLSRIDGTPWPECQDMSADPMTDADTMLVTYNVGEPVPVGGQLAVGALACELAKLACGDRSCRLPKRATQVAREGVTIMLPSEKGAWERGETGLWEVDRFIASIQAENRSGYKVTSPDVRPFRRVY